MVELTPRLSVLAAAYPETGGAAPFNAALVAALRRRGPVDFVSWRRLYPPLRRATATVAGPPRRPVAAAPLLDWADPRSWRRALHRVEAFGSDAVVLPWLHPVMAPPYAYLLRRMPRGVARIVICHNVLPHEPHRLAPALTRATLRHADVLVTHAAGQREELRALGLGATPLLEAFHPHFAPEELACAPTAAAVRAERARLGDPDLLLLCFGAVRPYKGVDLALEALARVDPALRVKLVVAGRFWAGKRELVAQAARLRLAERVELRDRYVDDDETALLFGACDAVLLAYRSATQSGVVGLALGHGRPVVATAVGGLAEAVDHGRDGLLCPPGDPDALARAIERLAGERARLRAGAEATRGERSFDRYAQLLAGAARAAR